MAPTHKGHIEIPNHSPRQAAMFFAVSAALGFKAEEVKERAKSAFGYSCFNKLSISDMAFLIDKLVRVQFKKDREEV